jgi:hypothetical protein
MLQGFKETVKVVTIKKDFAKALTKSALLFFWDTVPLLSC